MNRGSAIAALALATGIAVAPGPTAGAELAPAPDVRCQGRVATIVGTDCKDTIQSTPGVDVIHGRKGSDTIHGNGGNDLICGGDGTDRLFGGRDVFHQPDDSDSWWEGDDLQGGPGNDHLGLDKRATFEMNGEAYSWRGAATVICLDVRRGRATGEGIDTFVPQGE